MLRKQIVIAIAVLVAAGVVYEYFVRPALPFAIIHEALLLDCTSFIASVQPSSRDRQTQKVVQWKSGRAETLLNLNEEVLRLSEHRSELLVATPEELIFINLWDADQPHRRLSFPELDDAVLVSGKLAVVSSGPTIAVVSYTGAKSPQLLKRSNLDAFDGRVVSLVRSSTSREIFAVATHREDRDVVVAKLSVPDLSIDAHYRLGEELAAAQTPTGLRRNGSVCSCGDGVAVLSGSGLLTVWDGEPSLFTLDGGVLSISPFEETLLVTVATASLGRFDLVRFDLASGQLGERLGVGDAPAVSVVDDRCLILKPAMTIDVEVARFEPNGEISRTKVTATDLAQAL